ncbi:hypothetical protein [Microbacterium deminutum]|uniref:Tc toxin complex TcA C-terminal TcB-binding domain-containing protein n=1 Tax=Microbacterium deminutum TaxID=344164 RepID=A0ABP5CF44_9MICO
MREDTELMLVHVHVTDAATDAPLAGVLVEALTAAGTRRKPHSVAEATTGPDGQAEIAVPADAWCAETSIRAARQPQSAVALTRAMVEGRAPVFVTVAGTDAATPAELALLADHLIGTRRVLVDDVLSDLAAPAPDSTLALLPPTVRARLLADVTAALQRDGAIAGDAHIVDPVPLRNNELVLKPFGEVAKELLDRPGLVIDPERVKPGIGWGGMPWALPDDQSYRDYLRGVFVLFVHQQKLGFTGDPKTFPGLVEEQLTTRFFQDFRTEDRTEVPLNKLLVPIVTKILTAAKASGFGFGVPAGSLPAQGTKTDRAHLDTLLSLAPVGVDEVMNRYRLPLTEPDTVTSSRVKLNIHTLSRALSDTAQGPVEPHDNIIVPQLPGEQGRPILWPNVVGAAPFFLRFDEWLARQQPFFAENLFALRTIVAGGMSGIWFTEARKKFLDYHKSLPGSQSMTPYNTYFGSMDEVHRSADFLLKFGAAELKIAELIAAIDKSQFPTAHRLAEEARHLLEDGGPQPKPGEDWEPSMSVGNFPRPISFSRRRRLKVGSITELAGTGTTYPPDGFERFWELARPEDLWLDVVHFRIARDQATRLRVYQLQFLVPMLRAMARAGMGDLPGAVEVLNVVTGFHVGMAMLGTAAGMINDTTTSGTQFHVVGARFREKQPLGDRPYTARLLYDDERFRNDPFPLTPQIGSGNDILTPSPPILHALEERYARLVQGDALLAWAETLYRTEDAASLERARELYKAVIFLHGEDPGTSAYLPFLFMPTPWVGLIENPRKRNQLDRARLALHQLAAGLNFYGYSDDAVPTLRYETLTGAAGRWATGAKGAQTDYLAYLGRVEQLDLDMLAAKAQERKASATVAIAAEQVEIAQAGVVVAQKLVANVEKQIEAKKKEIEDANSLFSQFKDYFSGMKDGVSSLVDIGSSASSGWSSLSSSGVGDSLGLGAEAGAGGAESSSAGLGSAAGGLGVLGGFAAFAVLSTTTLQGMADAATKRDGELKALREEALPAAQAAQRVQERNVTIARLQGEIAATELAYARDLGIYQNERFLNRDFWDALAGVARRSLRRYLDLAAQAAWFAERALAYSLARSIRVIRLGYFDARMRDVGSVDRLMLDLAELEAVRLGAARITVPVTYTCSLARDLPLAYGQLLSTGRCTFAMNDETLIAAHPGTYAHRIRAVDVVVEAPGTPVPVRGILTNAGFSLLRREPSAAPVPLVRFADAYPVSEFRVRRDLELHGMPGEHLLPFEGAGFTTVWTLELPKAANAVGLTRVTDVRITFDVQAAYEVPRSDAAAAAPVTSRATFVSALAIDPAGLAKLPKSGAAAKLRLQLDALALPEAATVTNLAVLLPGVEGGSFDATVKFGGGPATNFTIDDGIAMSNTGVLNDGIPANAQALNAATGTSPAQKVNITIKKGAEAARLARARDVLLWVEYDVP